MARFQSSDKYWTAPLIGPLDRGLTCTTIALLATAILAAFVREWGYGVVAVIMAGVSVNLARDFGRAAAARHNQGDHHAR